MTDAYKRYLEGRIRAHFKLIGTPLRIEMRSSKNPFVDEAAVRHGLTTRRLESAVLRCPAPDTHHGA